MVGTQYFSPDFFPQARRISVFGGPTAMLSQGQGIHKLNGLTVAHPEIC